MLWFFFNERFYRRSTISLPSSSSSEAVAMCSLSSCNVFELIFESQAVTAMDHVRLELAPTNSKRRFLVESFKWTKAWSKLYLLISKIHNAQLNQLENNYNSFRIFHSNGQSHYILRSFWSMVLVTALFSIFGMPKDFATNEQGKVHM